MKLLSLFVFVATLLLITDVVPIQGWNLFGSNSAENKTKIQTDELPSADEEKMVDQADQDYENANSKASQAKLEGAFMGMEDDKIKFEIDDGIPTSNIDTVHELTPQNQTNYNAYDRTPAQSEFVDNAPHPTQSQGMDPRFVNRQPRQCSDGQYLCEKATPTQEHVRCIPNEWKCNGVRDCENNDDEDGCSVNHHRPQPNGCVPGYQYQCFGSGINGLPAMCIDNDKKCNGVYDCNYGDDENQENCPTGATNAPRRTEETLQNVQETSSQSHHHQTRPVQAAPTYNYHNEQAHTQAPPQPQPGYNCPNEEHYNRLAWTDRCIRTCISRSNGNNHHRA